MPIKFPFLSSKNDHIMDSYTPLLACVEAKVKLYQGLDTDQLLSKMDTDVKHLRTIQDTDWLSPSHRDSIAKVLAVLSVLCQTVYNVTPYDEQLVAVIELLRGRIVEQKTGEGKTLVAAIASVFAALLGESTHVVTTNEYLATRDGLFTQKLAEQMGIEVGIVRNQMETHAKQIAYQAPIVYTTHQILGFDYLRDHLVVDAQQKVQTTFNRVIVDEADNILIDDARTPLIISDSEDTTVDSKHDIYCVNHVLSQLTKQDVIVDLKHQSVQLTENALVRVNRALNVSSIYDPEHIALQQLVTMGLQAHFLKEKDVDYLVVDAHTDPLTGEEKPASIELIDASTGRVLEGRRYSDGLHAAIEAKEGLLVQEETDTVAQITYQEFFNLYPKRAGMTGTAHPEDDEFYDVYGLLVSTIPTHKPVIREDKADHLFTTTEDKFIAVAAEVAHTYQVGQPILVGTASVEDSEQVSHLLTKRGIPHEVLNALNHAREAEIVAKAGQKGAVTIATNMAGRGTDIQLGEGVAALGGLYVLGTSHNRSKRIDDQLRGRSGRQGQPGKSCFYVSLEDESIQAFATERVKTVLKKQIALAGDELVLDGRYGTKRLRQQLANLQTETSQFDSESRKTTFRFANITGHYRDQVYTLRDTLLAKSMSSIFDNLESSLATSYLWLEYLNYIKDPSRTNLNLVYTTSCTFPSWSKEQVADWVSIVEDAVYTPATIDTKLVQFVYDEIRKLVETAIEKAGVETDDYTLREQLVRTVVLQTLDHTYSKFLAECSQMRETVGLQSYAGQDSYAVYLKLVGQSYHNLFDNLVLEWLDQLLTVDLKWQEPVLEESNQEVLSPEKQAVLDQFVASEQISYGNDFNRQDVLAAYETLSNILRDKPMGNRAERRQRKQDVVESQSLMELSHDELRAFIKEQGGTPQATPASRQTAKYQKRLRNLRHKHGKR